jgi:Cysteine-rich secretory protein family
MSVHSASGRKSVRIPRGPAKVIPLPVGQRRRRYRRALAFGIGSFGAAAAGAALAWFYLMPLIGLAPDLTAGMSIQEAEILRLVNDERRHVGAPALKSEPRLVLASRGHSYDMALRNYFGHNGPAGDTPAERAHGVGIDSTAVGETLYAGRGSERDNLAGRAVSGWLGDAAMRARMLSSQFAITGVGIARAADGTEYVTEDFANQAR